MKSGLFYKNIFRSEGVQRYLKNTVWMLGERVGTLGVSFLVSIFAINYLETAGAGLLGVTVAWASFFVILSALGLGEIVTRNIVNNPEDTHKILGTAFFLKLAASLVGLVCVLPVVLIATKADQVRTVMLILVVGTTLFHSTQVVDFYFNSQVMSRYSVRIRLIQFLVVTVSKLLFIYLELSVEWFAAVILIGDAVLAAGYITSYQRLKRNIFSWRFSRKYARELLKQSWPLIISGFVIVIYMRTDQLMITHLINEEANGIYYSALRFSEIWYFIPNAICVSLFPAILNSRNNNYKLYMRRVQSLFDLMVFLSLGLAIGITVLGDWIIGVAYKPEFQPATSVLKIHVWASFFVFLGVASTQWLVAENLQKIALNRSILGAIVNIGLNFALIPRLGINGAAIATLVSQAVASYFGYLLTRKTWIIFRMQSRAFLFWLFFKKENYYNLIQKN